MRINRLMVDGVVEAPFGAHFTSCSPDYERDEAFQREYAGLPLMLVHLICFIAVIFVGVRFYGLFPKAQPAKIGPAKPPPRSVILAMLYAAWIAVSGGLALVMAGGIFR